MMRMGVVMIARWLFVEMGCCEVCSGAEGYEVCDEGEDNTDVCEYLALIATYVEPTVPVAQGSVNSAAMG